MTSNWQSRDLLKTKSLEIDDGSVAVKGITPDPISNNRVELVSPAYSPIIAMMLSCTSSDSSRKAR